MTTIQITLPDALARRADRAGLLDPGQIEAMLRDTLRARREATWRAIQAEQESDPLPPMTYEEIQVEVDAVRAEQRLAARA